MTNLVNLDRDGFFTTLKTADELSWSTGVAVGDTINCNSSGTVNAIYGSARSDKSVAPSITAGQWEAIGVLMEPPKDDMVPYRLKAYTNTAYNVLEIGIGYAPSSPTGSDDAITPLAVFPMTHNCFDEIFMIPALDSGDGDYGKAICFLGAVTFNTGSTPANFALSVQRLATAPPPYMKLY